MKTVLQALAATATLAGALYSGEQQVLDTLGSALLTLRGAPAGAVVVINNDTLRDATDKPFAMRTGIFKVSVIVNERVAYSRPLSFQKGENIIVNVAGNPNTSSVSISGDPAGAAFFMDEQEMGATPFRDSMVEPGFHKMEVRKAGYEPFMKMVLLTPQEIWELNLNLSHTQAWKDSVARVKLAERKKRQFYRRVTFGVFTLALGAASAYFELQARKSIKSADAASQNYDAAREGFQTYKDQYYAERDAAKRHIDKRNILAALAAGGGLGFVVSFVF